MNILALDTSSKACSVALAVNNMVYSDIKIAPKLHAKIILSQIQQLIHEADITLEQLNFIAFGCGPGAFTGLRIAASVVQAFAIGLNAKIIAISTLETLAYRAYLETKINNIIVANDARMREVYYGVYQYQQGKIKNVVADSVLQPELIQLPYISNDCVGIGDGFNIYADKWQIKPKIILDLPCDSKDMLNIAKQKVLNNEFVELTNITPNYIRNNIAAPQVVLHAD